MRYKRALMSCSQYPSLVSRVSVITSVHYEYAGFTRYMTCVLATLAACILELHVALPSEPVCCHSTAVQCLWEH
jgi:hypothetical protein